MSQPHISNYKNESTYEVALSEWTEKNVCPSCESEVGEDELKIFNGLCENCNDEVLNENEED